MKVQPVCYEFEWGGMGVHSGAQGDGTWDYDEVAKLFEEYGCEHWTPGTRTEKTVLRRTLASLAGVSESQITEVGSLLVVPDAEEIHSADEVERSAAFTTKAKVRIDPKTREVKVSRHLATRFEGKREQVKTRLTGQDIKNRFAIICREALGGVMKRSGEFYIPNDAMDPHPSYEPGMRRVAELIKRLGGRCSITPIYNEENLAEYVMERAAEDLEYEFKALQERIAVVISRKDVGTKVRPQTKVERQEEFDELLAKAKWFASRFGSEAKKLQEVVKEQEEATFASITKLILA